MVFWGHTDCNVLRKLDIKNDRPAQVQTIYGFKTDKVEIEDEYDVGLEDVS